MSAQHLPADVERLRQALLAWYEAEARSLPWRRDRSPWGVLVSEVMLQQTQVARVEPTWLAFLARFPTPAALAAAPVAEALTLWRGLGYNRRAVRLHQTACAIVEHHAGKVPDDLDGLLSLPGIGAYTARAVLAFAYDASAAPVDTNVARVLRRAVAGRALVGRSLQELADAMVPTAAAGDWSSAVMDLGAGVCSARSPRCAACPLAADCVWRSNGGEDPARRAVERSAQPAFGGSDRFHRGRLVDALRAGPVPAADVAVAAQVADPDRVDHLVAGIVRDGLAEWSDGRLRLPGSASTSRRR